MNYAQNRDAAPSRGAISRRTLLTAAGVAGGLAFTGRGGLAAAATAAPTPVPNPASYVNPMIGTGIGGRNVGAVDMFPGPDAPFGMIQWGPDTSPAGVNQPVGYAYSDSVIEGFSLTRLSGVGSYIFRDIEFLPTTKPVTRSPGTSWSSYTSGFSHRTESAKAGYYGVHLSNGIHAELTAATRGALGRFSYPAGSTATMLINATSSMGYNGSSLQITGPRTVVGWTTGGHFLGHSQTKLYTVYFAVEFDHPFVSYGTWRGATVSRGAKSVSGRGVGGWVDFNIAHSPVVHAKVAISYVSVDGALKNLAATSSDFATVQKQTYALWNEMLLKIKVTGGTSSELTTFYTALYHALLCPTTFSDVDGSYMGFDGVVHQTASGHVQYANYSGWDIYRSQVRLLAMLVPSQASDMMQSLVNDAEQGGWLPKWPVANTYTAGMGGDSADQIIADAYAFGATDFDTKSALQYMIKGATDTTSPLGQGWYYPRGYQATMTGIADYLKDGYVPTDSSTSSMGSSLTLEFAVADFAIAQFAGALGDSATYDTFMRRAQNWQNVFDPASGYIQPRGLGGAFLPATDPATNKEGFEEGNAAQYTWMIPQNLAALLTALGGTGAVIARLDTFFTQLNAGSGAPYEWAGNEVTFGAPWIYNYAGAPWKTQRVVRDIITQLYSPLPGGEPGNDDLGAISSWYVWAAIGLYPATPGTSELTVGSPLFPQITISMPGGGELRINAPGAGAGKPYVHRLTLNGAAWDKPWLPASVVQKGATLGFTLSAIPDQTWGSGKAAAPASYSQGEAPAIGFVSDPAVNVAASGSVAVTIGAQNVTGTRQTVSWTADVPKGLSLTPAAGSLSVPPGGRASQVVSVRPTGIGTTAGPYLVQVHEQAADGTNLPPVIFQANVSVRFGSGGRKHAVIPASARTGARRTAG